MPSQTRQSSQFAEEGFVSHQEFLPDSEYARVLDNIIIPCLDLVIVAGDKMLVGKRRDEPAIHQWWTSGGRWNVGEDRLEAAHRITKKELGLKIDPGRFIQLGFVPDFVWRTRAQKPVCHGCHMLSLFHFVVITEDEKRSVNIAPDFLDSRWVNVQDAIDGVLDIELHDAIKQAALRVSLVMEMTTSRGGRLLAWIMRNFFGESILR